LFTSHGFQGSLSLDYSAVAQRFAGPHDVPHEECHHEEQHLCCSSEDSWAGHFDHVLHNTLHQYPAELLKTLAPRQLGVGFRGDAEAVVNAAQAFVSSACPF